ncbi:MAG: helix-turn-helix domain-containing protein [Lawsonibacter sp.]|nr:helix-turn-helix domain-containing protein [Lawsonibacter sp.]MDE6934627.1 helix-turn-helix domain-containing protein [Oscillospiraceae bacterium]
MTDKALGLRLKKARESARLTQKKVCEAVKIPKVQTYSEYECGKRTPPLELIKKLSRLYQVSIDWIAFGEDSNLPERKAADDIRELFRIVDRLGLCFREETEMGDPTGRYVIYLENSRRRELDSLIAALGRINGIRNILEQGEYNMLFQGKISSYAASSNDFEEIPEEIPAETGEGSDAASGFGEEDFDDDMIPF